MFRKNFLLIFILSSAFLSTASLPAYAIHSDYKMEGKHVDRMMRHIGISIKDISLTDEQKNKIKAIFDESKAFVTEHRKEMVSVTRQLIKEQIGAEKIDQAKIDQLAKKHDMLLSEMTVEKNKMITSIRDILTPEQRKKIVERSERYTMQIEKRISEKTDKK